MRYLLTPEKDALSAYFMRKHAVLEVSAKARCRK